MESLSAGLTPMPIYTPEGILLIEIMILYDSVANAREEALELEAKLASVRARFKSVKARHASAKRREESTLKNACDKLANAKMIMDPASTSAK
jgi:hypothetical protein